jgi:hypothetical protein
VSSRAVREQQASDGLVIDPLLNTPAGLDRLRYLHELQGRSRADSLDCELAFIQGLRIEDKVSGGLVPFLLWDFQKDLIGRLRENDRVFILKSRQLGATWSVLAHLLYQGMAGGNRLFLIASQSGSDAIDALHRLRILYNSIPNPAVALVTDNTEQIALANGSRFESMMATKRAGRGKAAYATFADEFAYFTYPKEMLAALDSASQRLYAVTTGAGPEDLANAIWDQAIRGVGRWHPVFYPWNVHPDRDEDWYKANVTESPAPDIARREYASTPEEAFAAPSGNYFSRFSRDRNVAEFKITASWPASYGIDFGFVHPFCVFVQVAPSGQAFVFGEYAPEEVPSPEFAQGILRYQQELFAAEGVTMKLPMGLAYCDPAGNARNMQTSKSEYDVMRAAGFRPHGQQSSVRDGCDLLMNAIASEVTPLVVHPRCVKLIRALTQMPPDKAQPDIYLQKHPVFSHPLDALRYWLTNNRHHGEFVPPPPMRRRAERVF